MTASWRSKWMFYDAACLSGAAMGQLQVSTSYPTTVFEWRIELRATTGRSSRVAKPAR